MKQILPFVLCIHAIFLIIEAKPWYASSYSGVAESSGGGYDQGQGFDVDNQGSQGYINEGYRRDEGGSYGYNRNGMRNGGGFGGAGNRGGSSGGNGRTSRGKSYADYNYQPRLCRNCKINNIGNGKNNHNNVNVYEYSDEDYEE